jgi:hypothetical protein
MISAGKVQVDICLPVVDDSVPVHQEASPAEVRHEAERAVKLLCEHAGCSRMAGTGNICEGRKLIA